VDGKGMKAKGTPELPHFGQALHILKPLSRDGQYIEMCPHDRPLAGFDIRFFYADAFIFLISSVSLGTTSNRSPTIP